IATINCRGLTKTSDPQQCNNFIQHLRSQNIHLLAIQESHAKDFDLQTTFHN
ncbi:hypothetical protein CLU79DRAFT_687863, partial [Phycomyces nitens]